MYLYCILMLKELYKYDIHTSCILYIIMMISRDFIFNVLYCILYF